VTVPTVEVGPVAAEELDPVALQQLWFDVTEAGGAVGLRPPITLADTRPLVDELLLSAAEGRCELVAARATSTSSQHVVGLVAIERGRSARVAHRVLLRRLMVHPDLQGTGVGARLVLAAHELARVGGGELVVAELRDGLGLEGFYTRLGYRECGRIPGALAFGDDRLDEVLMVADLRDEARDARG
jgi:predicted N-acetyltransferase YhbS